ncbi:MAG: pyruvate synthase, partial [Dehalococcoidia bacterium]|nr:pyruvate synthase [Dehalococcoidia bacterium]
GRIPVREYLVRQGRFAHLVEEDIAYIQRMVDEMWEEWEIPGVAPLRGPLAVARKQPAGTS